MAKFKAIVRYQRPDGYYTVYIRVIHNRKIQYIKTDKVVNQKGIDKNNYVCDPFVMKYCADKIALYTELLNKQDVKDWDVNEIVSYLIKGSSDLCRRFSLLKIKRLPIRMRNRRVTYSDSQQSN